jgi:hypothetical protein
MSDPGRLPQMGATIDEYLIQHLPSKVKRCLAETMMRGVVGQVLINFNGGEPQSFELKEHHRILAEDWR